MDASSEGQGHNKESHHHPLPVPSRILGVATTLNLSRSRAPGCALPGLVIEQKISTGIVQKISYHSAMTQVAALLKEASKLDLSARAELVSSLLEDLDPEPHYVSDEEVIERLEELRSGKVKGHTKEEFWKACGRP